MEELLNKSDIKNMKDNRDIDNYRYYTARYLFRSFRIYKSIILLSIYDQFFEAKMISRSLLDNIAETKYFMNSRRGKTIRLIKLHELINSKKEYKLIHSEDAKNINRNGHIFLSKYSIEYKKRLRKEVVEELQRYKDEEVMEIEENIKNSRSWYGLSRYKLYKKVDMQDCYRDYKDSCKIIHIAEENPFAVLESSISEFASKIQAYMSSKYMISHLKHFRNMCLNTFDSLEAINALENLEKSLNKSSHEEIMKHEPSILEPYKVTFKN